MRVQSSAMTDVEYDAPTRTLRIRFPDGDWYSYLQVPPEEHLALLAAPSLGRHFAAHIRDRYPFRRG